MPEIDNEQIRAIQVACTMGGNICMDCGERWLNLFLTPRTYKLYCGNCAPWQYTTSRHVFTFRIDRSGSGWHGSVRWLDYDND